ncbi:MAG: histidinol-phosphatase [Emcibacteraceae bacterium]|nr:histidinol-phosphatase [Emcibacteraceae bacterium]
MSETQEFIDFMNELGDAAAEVSLKYFKKSIDVLNKGAKLGTTFDPVTVADRNTEFAIRELIRDRYPTHGIMGEEHSTEKGSSEYTWVIDPIDGTRAYITGVPTWGTLIALQKNGKTILGMLDQPYLKERYIGSVDGSTLNGDDIKIRGCETIFDATLSTTDPLQLFKDDEEQDKFFRVASGAKMMRNGYDCYAYAMVASGFMDVVIEAGLESYDIQAIIPIIEGAGGIITNWQGKPVTEGGQVVACGDARLHKQVIGLLNTSI